MSGDVGNNSVSEMSDGQLGNFGVKSLDQLQETEESEDFIEDEESDDESDDLEEEEASDDEEILDDDADDDEELEEEDEPGKNLSPVEKEKRKFQKLSDKLQDQVNTLQADKDNAVADIQILYQEILKLKNGDQDSPAEDVLAGLEDDEILDVKTLRKVLSEKPKEKQPPQQDDLAKRSLAWSNSRPDIDAVNAFVGEHGLLKDAEVSATPTNDAGFYWAVKYRMLEKKIADGSAKPAKGKKKKANLPPTAKGPGAKGKKKAEGSPVGNLLAGVVDKYGLH